MGRPHSPRRLVLFHLGYVACSRRAGKRTKLVFDHNAQWCQVILNCYPHLVSIDLFVIVPVNATCTGHLLSRDRRMPSLQVVGSTARRFGDDFEAMRDAIDPQCISAKGRTVELVDEALCQANILQDIIEPPGKWRRFRMHRLHRRSRTNERRPSWSSASPRPRDHRTGQR